MSRKYSGTTTSARGRPAMTLIEMAITVFATSVFLFLVTGWMTGLREKAKEDLARRVLADLDETLVRYRRNTGSYPISRGPDSDIPPILDLVGHDKTRPILEAFPRHLWRGPGMRHLVDPWGTALRYLPSDSDDPRVKANGGRPLFVSAGPDRDFGDHDPAAIGDNLRSDDPGPEGFRLHDALRNALVDEEQERGKKNNQ
ncbi:MAG: hypothetical protein MI923_08995 [Phycisphaerales bacterium]|nr:hypothetical protein [Phycisphaerales bacterium]